MDNALLSFLDGGKYLCFVKTDGTLYTAWYTFRFAHCHNMYALWNIDDRILIRIEMTSFIPTRWDRDEPTEQVQKTTGLKGAPETTVLCNPHTKN